MPTVNAIRLKILKEGQPVHIQRRIGSSSSYVSADVMAFVRGYGPSEIVNDIQQGDRELRISPLDLKDKGFPDAPRRPDQVKVGESYATVQSCETVKLRGMDAVYILQIRGG